MKKEWIEHFITVIKASDKKCKSSSTAKHCKDCPIDTDCLKATSNPATYHQTKVNLMCEALNKLSIPEIVEILL